MAPDGTAVHQGVAGGVNPLYPHRRAVSFTALPDNSPAIVRVFEVLVAGEEINPDNFHVTQPGDADNLILTVLRDPPGSKSFSELHEELSYDVAVSFDEGIGTFSQSHNWITIMIDVEADIGVDPVASGVGMGPQIQIPKFKIISEEATLKYTSLGSQSGEPRRYVPERIHRTAHTALLMQPFTFFSGGHDADT